MRPDKDVIVVGAGIMGATIAKTLQQAGMDVLVIDNRNQLAGSPASAGHMRYEWTKGMSPGEFDQSLKHLSNVWPVSWEEYKYGPDRPSKIGLYRVDMKEVMGYKQHTLDRKVTQVWLHPLSVEIDCQFCISCSKLIVCAGAWADELIQENLTAPRQGISYLYKGKINQPRVHQYAPYKQAVCFQVSEGVVWAGDGTAVKPESWVDKIEGKARRRCEEVVRLASPHQIHTIPQQVTRGLRPYPKTKLQPDQPCIYLQMTPKCWVVTGGTKQSTIAAGWAARRLLDVLS